MSQMCQSAGIAHHLDWAVAVGVPNRPLSLSSSPTTHPKLKMFNLKVQVRARRNRPRSNSWLRTGS